MVPLSMGFPRQEYWLPFPSPGDLPDPGIEPTFPALAGELFTTEPPGKPSQSQASCKNQFKLLCLQYISINFNHLLWHNSLATYHFGIQNLLVLQYCVEC